MIIVIAVMIVSYAVANNMNIINNNTNKLHNTYKQTNIHKQKHENTCRHRQFVTTATVWFWALSGALRIRSKQRDPNPTLGLRHKNTMFAVRKLQLLRRLIKSDRYPTCVVLLTVNIMTKRRSNKAECLSRCAPVL